MEHTGQGIRFLKRLGALVVAVSLLGLAACGQNEAGREDDVRWDLRVTNAEGHVFVARAFLDGRPVFEATRAASDHATTLQGRFALSNHLVEFEILSPEQQPSTYVATVSYVLQGDGRAGLLDGVPTSLRANERLRMVVSLAAEPSM